MKAKKLTLVLTAGVFGFSALVGAVPGPAGNFDKNAFWTTPDINGADVNALATRGLLFFDMTNDVGAVDRLIEALRGSIRENGLSAGEDADLRQVLATASVLARRPDAVKDVEAWLARYKSSPHRADMKLLKADLLLEQGLKAEARAEYADINVDALSPNLRADYLYHKALTELLLGNDEEAKWYFTNIELQRSEVYGNAVRFYNGYLCYLNKDYHSALKIWDYVNTNTQPGAMADYYRAQIAYYEGRYSEAIRLGENLVQRSGVPALYTAEANRILGEALYQKGNPTQAIPYLKKYLAEVETPERSALYILGLSYYEEGEYKSAVKALTPVTTEKSAMGQSAFLYIGQALLKLDDDSGAIMAFNRALEMDVDPAVTEVAYYNYAVAKSRGGNVPFASSVTTFEEFLTRYPDSRFADDVATYIVTGYVSDGDYQSALKSINKISHPSDRILKAKQNLLYTLGAKTLAAGKAEEAVKLLREAQTLARYDKEIAAETNLILGEALYRTGDYEESAEALLAYLDEAPQTAPNRPIALYDLGYTRLAQKEWSKAETNFERLLAAPGSLNESTLADAQLRLADALYYQRRWAEAANAYDAAFTLNPGSGDYPLFQKAVMQGYNRDYSGKLETLERLIGDFPSSALMPDALLEQAEAYTQLRRPENARNTYRKLIDNYGETAQGRKAYIFLASDMAGNGKIDEAIEIYEQLISRAANSDEARLADEAVKRLHAEQGTLNEYATFIETVDGIDSMDVAEAEELSWNAAEHAYLSGKGAALLEKYVKDYPKGSYAPHSYGYLLEDADERGDENDSYRWASLIVSNYPDNEAVENALMIKADIEYDRGRGLDALYTWQMLEQKASTPENKNTARMGIMRVARDTGDAESMRRAATALLSSSTLGSEEKTEAAFSLALAKSMENDTDGALEQWLELAENADDLYGAKSAVYAAETLNNAHRSGEAAKVAEKFVNSGTPHTYWLARGFIALSDAYKAQGKNFEAMEYLKALKENYPGDEADIFDMIEERFN